MISRKIMTIRLGKIKLRQSFYISWLTTKNPGYSSKQSIQIE